MVCEVQLTITPSFYILILMPYLLYFFIEVRTHNMIKLFLIEYHIISFLSHNCVFVPYY